MKLSPDYLAQYVVAPDDLHGLREHIRSEIRARRRPSFTRVQQRKLLLAGSPGASAAVALDAGFWGDFVDASEVERSADGILRYLERLIAPDRVSSVRTVISEYLGIGTLPDIAHYVAILAEGNPDAATALLELRIARAQRLMTAEPAQPYDEDAEHLTSRDLLFLVEEFARIRIAFRLRLLAEASAGQIHTPFNWGALDDLEEFGTLRFGTLEKRLLGEIALVERAFDLYERDPAQSIPSAMRANGGSGQSLAAPLPPGGLCAPLRASETRVLDDMGLVHRAYIQLAIWSATHGDALEDLLRRTIVDLRRDLICLKHRIAARSKRADYKTIVSNIGRPNAGVRLWFAVEEAIAWTAEPADRFDRSPMENARRVLFPQPGDPVNAIAAALRWVDADRATRGSLPVPMRERTSAHDVFHLFTALRFAFLADNEMLPVALRQVRDPATGKTVIVKTAAKAAAIRGRAIGFDELWTTFRWERRCRIRAVPKGDSPKERAAAIQKRADAITPHSEIRHAADGLRTKPAAALPIKTLAAMYALRPTIMIGFTAA